ncbi:MAG: GtrA family protein [Chthoniobacteraceae bacterium]|nr:GtrA family protein [Chthoniobacteraceae bacterium]
MDQSSSPSLSAPLNGGQPEEASLAPATAGSRQTLRSRIFWFLAGAVVNYYCISTPFHYLKGHTSLSLTAISACSIGLSTTFFFLWNYFVNFRGDSRRRDALARYIAAVVVMWAVSSTTLSLLKHFDFNFSLRLAGRVPLDLDIVATQFFIGGFKFLLYHRWVFPVGKGQRRQ